ncbi:TetR family transcriptional regulator, partial [Pseudomonas syringae pv. tagetis]
VMEHIRHQLLPRRDNLIAEQAYYHEALINPPLTPQVIAHQEIQLQGSCQFFQVFGSLHPYQDAQVLTGLIRRMEYQG